MAISDRAPIISAIEAFRNDPGYVAAANAEITYGSDALFYMRQFKERAEQILTILQS
ncbi:hypothetical protein [Rhodohalobacter sp. 8-1]|uniref:hypothetical protein n=1 Tax=Rhodohalobacter sp. 8-1 TaxID=3131972 RepID=UPI0030EC7F6A